MKSSYPRNISIISIIFIFLILFLAIINLYISIQLRNEFINYDRDKIVSIALVSSHYIDDYGPQKRDFLFRNLSRSFDLRFIVITDSVGNLLYDSRKLPFDIGQIDLPVGFNNDFKQLPEPGQVIQSHDKFIYQNSKPSFYFYTSLISYTPTFDKIFTWHIIYITVSLIFISFLGVFLIRNLFLPMRYVTRLAQDMGIQMKKEDFVSETFNEIFKKMKLKEETLVEFSSYIAHEFRNSIGAIIGLARLVEKGKKPASEIVKECRSMEELIKKLLDYSMPLKPVIAPVDFRELIDDALERTKIPARIEVIKNLKIALPECMGDYDLLLVTVTNLLKNSVEAIKRRKGVIEIDATREDDFLDISISDNGTGIDERDLDKIFSPFYSKIEKGMGVGLAYVKKIVELHNGRIEVQSKKRQGTTFTLRFPLKE
jgi:signal transduction histidine kinase